MSKDTSSQDPTPEPGAREVTVTDVVDLATFRAARDKAVFGPDNDDDPEDPTPNAARPAPQTHLDVAA